MAADTPYIGMGASLYTNLRGLATFTCRKRMVLACPFQNSVESLACTRILQLQINDNCAYANSIVCAATTYISQVNNYVSPDSMSQLPPITYSTCGQVRWQHVLSVRKMLLAYKDGKYMGVDRFGRALCDMPRKLIDKHSAQSITDLVKIWQFIYNIPDIIKQSIIPHLTDDVTYNDIVTKSEQCEGTNQLANAAHTKP